ncbi:MAG: amino acid permease, partial [Alphaproteobacteria bacterium]|nr:amino acid permease [Alphaproteobacteria bacterium]
QLQRDYLDSTPDKETFKRTLGLWQLVGIGLGGIIGVGIFVLTGVVAAEHAGPGVTLSFIIAGVASGAAALCYAEFASMIPVSGSAYTYSYSTLGEPVAWFIGWDLLLEYALVVAVVAIGWSGYAQALLAGLGINLPVWASGAIEPADGHFVDFGAIVTSAGNYLTGNGEGKLIDLPAILICLTIAWLLSKKTEMGVQFNGLLVCIKLFAVLLVIGAGAAYVNPENWKPFLPFGFGGVVTGAAIVFFAVFGYDTLTTAAEEAKNPQRDLPLAVIISLCVALTLYIIMSLVLTGIVKYDTLNNSAPVAGAFNALGLPWVTMAISVAAVAGITTVVFAFMLACARITFAMSRDGLLPKYLSGVHPKNKTPHRATIIAGVVTAFFAGLFPIGRVAELVNIGTLSAFVLICASVIMLRYKRPDLRRGFSVPFMPFIPLIGIGFSLWLISGLPVETWERFGIWLVLGGVIYYCYGRTRSRLA